MAITTREAREQILDDLAGAVERIALAVDSLGKAYELLSVGPADRLEAELYSPVQRAFGRGKRTLSQFAERCGLDAPELAQESAGLPSQGVKVLVEKATFAAGDADRRIADLQDTMLPIESGDAELRNGLTDVRELLAGLPGPAREFLRTLGR